MSESPFYSFLKYVEVIQSDCKDYWMAFVYAKQPYEDHEGDEPLPAMDVYAALDEIMLLDRVKRDHPLIEIAYTDGEIKELPPGMY